MPSISPDQAIELVGDSTVSSPPLPNERSKFYLYCRQKGLWPREVSGHDPVKEAAWFSEYEPLRNISPAYPPTLLLHGEKDTDVPYEQSVLMSKAFKRHNVDYEFITNPDWGHGFDGAGLKERSVQEAFDRILIFLKKHIR